MKIERSEVTRKKYEISGSHSGEDVNVGLLGCNTMWTCRQIPTFWRNILPQSSALCYNPEDQHPYSEKLNIRELTTVHTLCIFRANIMIKKPLRL
jgi:hypothetical protein